MNDLKLFESQYIRSVWNSNEDQWYFSIIDVVGVLTDSVNPSAYWRKLKQRLKSEGNETVTNCHKFNEFVARIPRLLNLITHDSEMKVGEKLLFF